MIIKIDNMFINMDNIEILTVDIDRIEKKLVLIRVDGRIVHKIWCKNVEEAQEQKKRTIDIIEFKGLPMSPRINPLYKEG